MSTSITKQLYLFFLSIILLCVIYSLAFAGEGDNYSWELRDGKFVKLSTKIEASVEVSGKIKWFADTGHGIFFIKYSETKDSDNNPLISYALGLIDKKETKISFEKDLPFKGAVVIKKCLIKGNNVYIIIQNDSSWFYTIDYTSLDITKDENVSDFEIINDRFYYIKTGPGGNSLVSGRESIPLTIKGNITIKNIIDNRLLLLESNDSVEMIDIKKMKNIYCYSHKTGYVLPDAYNLVVETIDQREKIDAQNFVFYKIFIDGFEKGRTATGLAQILKTFQEKIDTGVHIIQLERWKLNKAQKRYRRENNINQPDPFKLDIPENRVIKLRVSYDGKKHYIEKIIVNE